MRLERGNLDVTKEMVRDAGWESLVETCWQDLLFGLRTMIKSPSFTAAVVLTLALGIGANTAIFSVIDTVLLRPLSYPDPDRIVQFLLKPPQGGAVPSSSIADFRLWREHTRAFEDVSAYDFAGNELSLTGDVPEEVRGVHVTADYFRLFGASMSLGRTFTTEEASPNGGNVVILSDRLWRGRFNSDPSIAGKTISLNHEAYTVVGVAGEAFKAIRRQICGCPFSLLFRATTRPTPFKWRGV